MLSPSPPLAGPEVPYPYRCNSDADARHDACCGGYRGRCRNTCRTRHCCVSSFVWLSVIFNPAMIAIGIGFLASLALDVRASNIAAFDAAVKSWPNASLAFNGLNISVAAPTYPAGAASPLLQTRVDDYPDTDGVAALPTFGLHYSGASVTLSAPRGYSEGATQDISFSITPPGGTPVVSRISPVLFKSNTETDGNNRQRTNYWRLSSVCVIVDRAMRVVDGCAFDPASGSVAFGGLSKMGRDSTVPMIIPLDVRSVDDPYVIALRLTNGSMNFGLPQTAKIIVGGVLLGLGLLFLSAACNIVAHTPEPPARQGGRGGPDLKAMHEQARLQGLQLQSQEGVYAPSTGQAMFAPAMGNPHLAPYYGAPYGAAPVQGYGQPQMVPYGAMPMQGYGQPQMGPQTVPYGAVPVYSQGRSV